MRIVQFVSASGAQRVGAVRGGEVFDITDQAGGSALAALLAHARSSVSADGGERVGTLDELNAAAQSGTAHLRIPIDSPEVWGAGVTYKKSAQFRDEDTSTSKGIYDMVYSGPRPELFYKGRAVHCVGPNEAAGIRADSAFTAPEPELALVLSAKGEILGFTLCDDVSAWDIERENPLYLPQSKIFLGCVVLGPTIVTPDELGDPQALTLRCTIERGGETLFEDSVGLDRIKRTFEELIHYLRLNNPIQDGAVLTTGTGIIVTQEQALREGDTITLYCDPIGSLRHGMRKLPEDA
ncbi:MAG: 2-dehydro-3-deoxy-D-arabinonate dehydratase [uncultured Chloroflexi bacterium]|uniref:2-dehydro-3-deoxy-D-arabinonate dehydratase n=1 Tax=uncultured Chloroflexota bacterium TaxID=166587 RepID=A0A6J4KAL9_9CHLR|nr:MAG: 2-dehydro-3-deoxy-D-arabinonate dehydratase [uncultured Chloroflexota bacterium]